MKRLLAIALGILGMAGSPLAMPLFAASTSPACSPAPRPATEQRTPWHTTAQAALVVAAHLIDGADAYAAQRYTAATQVPGANLNAIDQQYSPISVARRTARPALIAAQSSIAVLAQLVRDHADTPVISTAACQTLAFIRAAHFAISQLAAAFSEAGLRDAPSFANVVNTVSNVMSVGPMCPGAQ